MKPMEYLFMQMRLEGIRLNREGLLTSLSAECDDLPLALFVKSSDGQTASFFSEATSPELRETLNQSGKEIPFPDSRPKPVLISNAGVAIRIELYKTYRFPEKIPGPETAALRYLSKNDPRIVDFGFGGFADEVYAVEEGGAIVSACVSARQNAECAEAWVYTAGTHRRRGLAQQAVRAWSREMQARNLIPFFSHKMENIASAGLAGKMELIPVFEEITIR